MEAPLKIRMVTLSSKPPNLIVETHVFLTVHYMNRKIALVEVILKQCYLGWFGHLLDVPPESEVP